MIHNTIDHKYAVYSGEAVIPFRNKILKEGFHGVDIRNNRIYVGEIPLRKGEVIKLIKRTGKLHWLKSIKYMTTY